MLRARRLLKNRPRRLKGWSPNRLVPNALTVMALCAGLTAIRFAIEAHWDWAVLAIVAAAVLDGLDGRAARLLKGTSRFGAELDSLSDFVSFGAAPAVLMFEWSMVGFRGAGWAVALLYAVCCALRLARFNSEIDLAEETPPPPSAKSYFKGVPAPAAAGLALLPVMFWLQFDIDLPRSPWVAMPVMVAVALLMISRVPTFSLKRITVPNKYVLPVLLLVGLIFAALASAPWATLIVVGLAYLASLPLSLILQPIQSRREAGTGVSEGASAGDTAQAKTVSDGGVIVSIPPRPSARG